MTTERAQGTSDSITHVRIDHLRVTAASGIEARRFAEQLPAALEAAFSAWPEAPTPTVSRHGRIESRLAASAAAQIVQAARVQLASVEDAT